jgi:hypothetical protein
MPDADIAAAFELLARGEPVTLAELAAEITRHREAAAAAATAAEAAAAAAAEAVVAPGPFRLQDMPPELIAYVLVQAPVASLARMALINTTLARHVRMRLKDPATWSAQVDLIDNFSTAQTAPPPPESDGVEIDWSWEPLRRALARCKWRGCVTDEFTEATLAALDEPQQQPALPLHRALWSLETQAMIAFRKETGNALRALALWLTHDELLDALRDVTRFTKPFWKDRTAYLDTLMRPQMQCEYLATRNALFQTTWDEVVHSAVKVNMKQSGQPWAPTALVEVWRLKPPQYVDPLIELSEAYYDPAAQARRKFLTRVQTLSWFLHRVCDGYLGAPPEHDPPDFDDEAAMAALALEPMPSVLGTGPSCFAALRAAGADREATLAFMLYFVELRAQGWDGMDDDDMDELEVRRGRAYADLAIHETCSTCEEVAALVSLLIDHEHMRYERNLRSRWDDERMREPRDTAARIFLSRWSHAVDFPTAHNDDERGVLMTELPSFQGFAALCGRWVQRLAATPMTVRDQAFVASLAEKIARSVLWDEGEGNE